MDCPINGGTGLVVKTFMLDVVEIWTCGAIGLGLGIIETSFDANDALVVVDKEDVVDGCGRGWSVGVWLPMDV